MVTAVILVHCVLTTRSSRLRVTRRVVILNVMWTQVNRIQNLHSAVSSLSSIPDVIIHKKNIRFPVIPFLGDSNYFENYIKCNWISKGNVPSVEFYKFVWTERGAHRSWSNPKQKATFMCSDDLVLGIIKKNRKMDVLSVVNCLCYCVPYFILVNFPSFVVCRAGYYHDGSGCTMCTGNTIKTMSGNEPNCSVDLASDGMTTVPNVKHTTCGESCWQSHTTILQK